MILSLADCRPGDIFIRPSGETWVCCGPIAGGLWCRQVCANTYRDLRKTSVLRLEEPVEIILRGIQRWPKGGQQGNTDPLQGVVK
jgi:hypothetical protein